MILESRTLLLWGGVSDWVTTDRAETVLLGNSLFLSVKFLTQNVSMAAVLDSHPIAPSPWSLPHSAGLKVHGSRPAPIQNRFVCINVPYRAEAGRGGVHE